MQRVRLVVVGIVQGVGFRPYIHRLVTEFNLKGWIRNESYGVELELEGTSQAIEGFVARLKAQPPRLAVIEALRVESCGALKNYAGFTIRASEKRGENNTLVIAPFTKDPVQLGFDLFVVPKGAQHTDLAYKFLNYVCDPQVMAANLVDNPYSCPNDAAVAAASEEYRNAPAFNFDYKTNVFFQKDVGDALTIYDKYYQMLKVG